MNPHRQIERDAALWLARRDAGGWGERQQAGLAAWLAEDIAHRVAFLRLEATWNEAARLQTLAAATHAGIPARGAWQDSPYFAPLRDKPLRNGPPLQGARRASVPTGPMHRQRPRARRRRWLVPAAAMASLVALAVTMGGLAWREITHVDRGAWQTLLGAQQVVHLADGSIATLGSASELSAAMSRRERDLYLPRGEAFFDVAHDPSRPFVVHVDGYRVIAVGTRFDVRRYETGLRVVVTHGLVRLQSMRDPGQAATELPAGSVANIAGNLVTVEHVPVDQAREYLTWRDGYVVFHGTPLAEAVREFNRYNATKIVLADPALDGLRVGGNFRLDNSGAFVRLMQEIFPLHAETRDKHIVLSRRQRGERR